MVTFTFLLRGVENQGSILCIAIPLTMGLFRPTGSICLSSVLTIHMIFNKNLCANLILYLVSQVKLNPKFFYLMDTN